MCVICMYICVNVCKCYGNLRVQSTVLDGLQGCFGGSLGSPLGVLGVLGGQGASWEGLGGFEGGSGRVPGGA